MVPGTAIVLLSTLVCSFAQNIWISTNCPLDPSTELLLPHEDDCTKYYLCSNGLKIPKQCPEETSFHVGLQGCEWSPDVTCHKSTTLPDQAPGLLQLIETRLTGNGYLPNGCPLNPSIEMLLPHSSDCTKYYQCTHGNKIERACPSSLHFDMAVQTCTYPDIANCTLSKPPDTTPIIEITPKTEQTTTKVTETTIFEYLPNGCPADIYSYFLVPHESDCKKYYVCTQGEKVPRECPADLHFDFALQGCNWSHIVKCKINDTPQYQTTKLTEIELATESSYLPNGCPKDQHIHHLLPHESDCTMFYQCTHGERVLKTCPSGLHFDVTYQVCNWPYAANCQISQKPTTETIKTTETEIITTKLPSTSPKTTTEVWPPTTELDSTTHWYDWTFETEEETVFAYTTEKTTTKVESETTDEATSNYYVPTISHLTTKEQTETPTRTEPTTTIIPTTDKPTTIVIVTTKQPTTEEPTTITDKITTTFKPTTTNRPTTNQPTSNLPTTTDKATTPQEIKTTENPQTTVTGPQTTIGTEPSPCLPGFFGNMAHPELCNAYYLCSAGLAIPLFCPNGYEFDPDIKICVPIKPGGCTLGGDGTYTTLSPTAEDSNQVFVTENPENITTTELTTKDINETTKTTILASTTTIASTTDRVVTTDNPISTIPPQISCPPGIIELLPNPGECTSYYMCFGGSALIMHCPNELEYDINSKTCLPIQEGGCTLGSTQSPKATSEASTDNNEADVTIVPTTVTLPTTIKESVSEVTTTTNKPTTPAICPPGAIASMPNPAECNVYYLCTGGMAIGPLYCPTGQEFDFDTKTCTAIKEGGCTLSGSSTTEPSTSEADYDETTSSHKPTESVTGPSWNQPGVPSVQSTIPPETTITITTELTETTEKDTNETTVTTVKVSATTEKVPETTEKVPETTEKVPETTEKVTTTTEKIQETTERLQDINETDTPPLCPPSVIVNVPHPEICDAYYLCFSGSAIAMYCPPGQEFDTVTKACVIIKDGGCTYNQAIQTTVYTLNVLPNYDNVQISSGQYARYKLPTNKVLETANEKTAKEITSKEITSKEITAKEITDKKITDKGKTDKETTVPPRRLRTKKRICGSNEFGHKPHPDMCNAFYMCSEGTAIPLLCAEGLEFDASSGLCEEIKEGGCTYNISSALLITPETILPPEISTKNAEITKSIIRGICNVTDFGYVPHPEKCDSYYMCTGGIAVPLKCQKGYEFNFVNRKCILITTGGCFARKVLYKRKPHIKRQTFILNSRWHQ